MHKRLSWLAVILWMTLIFYFSHQPATDSAKLSSGVTEFLFAAIQQLLPHVQLDLEQFHTIIRKLAHFFSYFTLGLLVFHALRQTRLNQKNSGLALLICMLYAISDEVHQLFIPGRSGEIRDVLIDTVGAFVGIFIYRMIHRLGNKR